MKNIQILFKSLSDQNRLRIVAALFYTNELCACRIKELLKVTGATVSRHMALLIQADLLDSRKDGKWVFYRFRKERSDIKALISWLKHEIDKSAFIKTDLASFKQIGSCEQIEMCRKQPISRNKHL